METTKPIDANSTKNSYVFRTPIKSETNKKSILGKKCNFDKLEHIGKSTTIYVNPLI
jgi:hypothetical protein